ncbi:hypothetical protein CR513_37781, partial [Mucuna pruriens]
MPTAARHLISNMATIHNSLGLEELANPEWAKSRTICNSVIQTRPECTSRTNKLLITDSTVSSTTFPTTTTTTVNASSRLFTISGGPDDAIDD